MEDRLKDGLRIGNLVVLPESGEIIDADGSHSLSDDRIAILLALADRPGEPITFAALADVIGEEAEVGHDVLVGHLHAIRDALSDTGPNPRFIVVDDTGAILIAPVRVGTPRTLEDDGEQGEREEVPFTLLTQSFR